MKVRNKALWIISTLVVLIILFIHAETLMALTRPRGEVWEHIRTHLLWDYTRNTVVLVVFSMLFSGIIGTLAAYFVSCFEFPFRKAVSLLLYLPLAIPPYINAYVYADMLGPFGLVHNLFGAFPRIPSLWLGVMVFTMTLFPYVYIGVRAFITHGMTSHIENARLLQKNERQVFFFVILPIAKTAILTGMVLVGLEVMGDFGASHYLGVHTYATAIFRSWLGFRDFDSALRLSGLAVIAVFILLIMKSVVMQFGYRTASNAKSSPVSRKKVKGKGVILPLGFPVFILFMTLALPLYRLITWAIMSFGNVRFAMITSMVSNSVLLSFFVTLLIVFLGFIIASYTKTSSRSMAAVYGKMTLISYSLPGAVMAMAVLFFFLNLNDILPWQLPLATSVLMLVVGYTIRYLGIAYESIEDGYKKIGKRHNEAARTLGKSYYRTLFKVDLPMLKPFIISSMALVFIDLIRELPLTLVLRPFNFHTLATQVYQYASDEMLPESAVPSLIIIGISMCFIALILRNKRRDA